LDPADNGWGLHSQGRKPIIRFGLEILAIQDGKAYLKYHQSKEGRYGTFMELVCPPYAAWFDDLPGNEKYWNKPVYDRDEESLLTMQKKTTHSRK
jgi:lysine 2,3-aminomutase